MEHIFIINPAAGKFDHSQQFRTKIESACRERGLRYEICVSEKAGDCRAIARRAAESGSEVRLYACGGDGTLNEAVNGIADLARVTLGYIPIGSSNDFARSLRLEQDPLKALEKILTPSGYIPVNIGSLSWGRGIFENTTSQIENTLSPIVN